MKFNPDGTVEVRDMQGEPVEKKLKWLLDNLGEVSRRGHKHAASREEGLKIKQG